MDSRAYALMTCAGCSCSPPWRSLPRSRRAGIPRRRRSPRAPSRRPPTRPRSTTRWDPPAQLAALGEYVEIHWQARALGDPCSRAPGPTDWSYQGVVKLRPEDARALAAQPGWQPATPEIWPALDEFAPPAADWQRADGDQAPTIYLDAASAVALFAITTS